eukprot:gene5493-11062_t
MKSWADARSDDGDEMSTTLSPISRHFTIHSPHNTSSGNTQPHSPGSMKIILKCDNEIIKPAYVKPIQRQRSVPVNDAHVDTSPRDKIGSLPQFNRGEDAKLDGKSLTVRLHLSNDTSPSPMQSMGGGGMKNSSNNNINNNNNNNSYHNQSYESRGGGGGSSNNNLPPSSSGRQGQGRGQDQGRGRGRTGRDGRITDRQSVEGRGRGHRSGSYPEGSQQRTVSMLKHDNDNNDFNHRHYPKEVPRQHPPHSPHGNPNPRRESQHPPHPHPKAAGLGPSPCPSDVDSSQWRRNTPTTSTPVDQPPSAPASVTTPVPMLVGGMYIAVPEESEVGSERQGGGSGSSVGGGGRGGRKGAGGRPHSANRTQSQSQARRGRGHGRGSNVESVVAADVIAPSTTTSTTTSSSAKKYRHIDLPPSEDFDTADRAIPGPGPITGPAAAAAATSMATVGDGDSLKDCLGNSSSSVGAGEGEVERVEEEALVLGSRPRLSPVAKQGLMAALAECAKEPVVRGNKAVSEESEVDPVRSQEEEACSTLARELLNVSLGDDCFATRLRCYCPFNQILADILLSPRFELITKIWSDDVDCVISNKL